MNARAIARTEKDGQTGSKAFVATAGRFLSFILLANCLPFLDRSMSSAQSALAEAVETFGRIDILLCNTSEAVVGAVEELSTSPATIDLARQQFEVIFYNHVNYIKAILPLLRAKHNGHILVLTGITGHIGTPGMAVFNAATWALEGFCDSLAYEIAPFNIKMTIIQPSKEISLLCNKIIFAPQLSQYESSNNPAPGLRDILSNVVNHYPEIDEETGEQVDTSIVGRYPKLPSEAADRLVMETVHALTALGGHENPPARHIVGYEGVASVKEKLKTVSEELEDFVEVSLSADGPVLPGSVEGL
jgi:NAD(P)-dependent dehydrogenase (short-subunit alcohol dehydrogenase family)